MEFQPLSQPQRDFFFANGYVSLGKLLDDATITLLRAEYDAEFARAETKNLAGDGRRMLQILHMGERNIHFRHLLHDARILDKIESLIGANIQLWDDQALWKPAYDGGPVTWHQDNAYWNAIPANLVSCWLTLDDVTRENGAMQFIPGSHLQPLWHQNTSSGPQKDVQSQIDTSQAVVVELPAGGALLHHCQTLHYTQPNETPHQRRAFAMHCCTPGTRSHSVEAVVGWKHPLLRARI